MPIRPPLPDRPARNPGRPLAVAHRRDPRAAVENTLEAVRRAADAGASAIEVDLRCTADGAVVLHHDDDLARLWGRPESVAALTPAELREFAPAVPTLREALDAAAGVPLLVDIGDPVIATAAHAELEHLGAVAMFCGAAEAMAAVRARDERITLFLSWYGQLPLSEDVLEAVRPQYFNPEHRFLSAEAVAYWHTRELLDGGRRGPACRTALLGCGRDHEQRRERGGEEL
ncbi:glycerophosphodiester phosphodiesterase [Streptomyces sp. NPDC058420]|uniref:glycerophosphodiester phosphodiesterase n=1 Tax=Streptomyces sp. NPDC058420 TaxID=3346489 RepID=UPI0036636BCF